MAKKKTAKQRKNELIRTGSPYRYKLVDGQYVKYTVDGPSTIVDPHKISVKNSKKAKKRRQKQKSKKVDRSALVGVPVFTPNPRPQRYSPVKIIYTKKSPKPAVELPQGHAKFEQVQSVSSYKSFCAILSGKEQYSAEIQPRMDYSDYQEAVEFFRQSKEWQKFRKFVLKYYPHKCNNPNCKSHNKPNVALHVDHILPIAKYPHLRLDPNNMQLLCAKCNTKKSDKLIYIPERAVKHYGLNLGKGKSTSQVKSKSKPPKKKAKTSKVSKSPKTIIKKQRRIK